MHVTGSGLSMVMAKTSPSGRANACSSVRAVVAPSADTGAIRVRLVSKDGRAVALLVAFDPANTRLDTMVVTIRTAIMRSMRVE